MKKELGIEDLKIDFLHDHVHYTRKKHRGKSEIIAKALGAGKGIKQVLDLTCGLAQDAFFLAQLGFRVRAFERSKPVFGVLQESLERARAEAPEREDLARLTIELRDSKEFLQSLEWKEMGDESFSIYLDPMFPEKKKSALPRKEMQIFRTLVGEDGDAGELLQLALRTSCDRVVVKRPLKAEPLAEGVIHRFEGTTIRYDLYTPRRD